MRHDPPRIVWSGRVWTSETEVVMPLCQPLPEDFQIVSETRDGKVVTSLLVDHCVLREHWFADTVDDLRTEREEIARQAMPAALVVTPGEPPLFDDEEDG